MGAIICLPSDSCAGLGPPQAKQLHRGGGREGSEAPRSPQGKLEHKIHAGILNFWSQPLKLLQFFRAGHIGTQDPQGSLDLMDGGPVLNRCTMRKYISPLWFSSLDLPDKTASSCYCPAPDASISVFTLKPQVHHPFSHQPFLLPQIAAPLCLAQSCKFVCFFLECVALVIFLIYLHGMVLVSVLSLFSFSLLFSSIHVAASAYTLLL